MHFPGVILCPLPPSFCLSRLLSLAPLSCSSSPLLLTDVVFILRVACLPVAASIPRGFCFAHRCFPSTSKSVRHRARYSQLSGISAWPPSQAPLPACSLLLTHTAQAQTFPCPCTCQCLPTTRENKGPPHTKWLHAHALLYPKSLRCHTQRMECL